MVAGGREERQVADGPAGQVPRQAGPPDGRADDGRPDGGRSDGGRGSAAPPSAPPPGQPPRPRLGRVGAAAVRAVGELLITLGLLVALFLAYQLWITDLFQARSQSRLHDRLTASWHGPATKPPAKPSQPPPATRPKPAVGQGFAVLHIPRLGDDYAPVVVEGVGEAQLEEGPGHYPGTAMPGETGNFVVSGHRTTYGKPFNRLDELRTGDPVVVEVSDRYYVYRMTRSEVVAPDRIDVTAPVPEHPGATPTAAVLTMTTCHPKYSAKSRLIVFASLDRTVMKAPGAGVPFASGEA
ncbi:class E sortase [Pseudofrankia sp. EUN1h]|nr:class E sortase [Pseudofrankia sp. EUN1h]